MPKLKTNKSARKRFKKPRTGKFLRHQAGKRHILTKKTTARKRKLDQETLVSRGDHKKTLKMLPYG